MVYLKNNTTIRASLVFALSVSWRNLAFMNEEQSTVALGILCQLDYHVMQCSTAHICPQVFVIDLILVMAVRWLECPRQQTVEYIKK